MPYSTYLLKWKILSIFGTLASNTRAFYLYHSIHLIVTISFGPKMASRVTKLGKKVKAAMDSVRHPPFLKIYIPAQQAKPAPPLGPQLGKDFNERTKHIKPGVPIPCTIIVNPDRSYQLQMSHPPSQYLLRMAAGAKKGAATPGKFR
ncbi:39S ribosomal protein L11 mitochondrial [Taenia crassiceps]|uniref:Large ribosomal subunit protein uL11m n=1 Tax=Taenia crassiceps TaxID=6207 RepID=A0ABR4QFF1_9CEST